MGRDVRVGRGNSVLLECFVFTSPSMSCVTVFPFNALTNVLLPK